MKNPAFALTLTLCLLSPVLWSQEDVPPAPVDSIKVAEDFGRFVRLQGHLLSKGTYDLEYSPDLSSWDTRIRGIVGNDKDRVFTLEDDSEGDLGFYRLRLSDDGVVKTEVVQTYGSATNPTDLVMGEDPIPYTPPAPPAVEEEEEEEEEEMESDVFDDGPIASEVVYFYEESVVSADFAVSVDPASPAPVASPVIPVMPETDPITFLPGPPSEPEPNPAAGLITAGEWNDHEHWPEFQTFVQQYPSHFTHWQLDFQNRVRIGFTGPNGEVLDDVKVTFNQECLRDVSARTHNDGRIVLFLDRETRACLNENANGVVDLSVQAGKEAYAVQIKITVEHDQVFDVKLPELSFEGMESERPRRLELCFVVDVTGSMSDELKFLREELLDITRQINEAEQIDDLRVASVFYRDRGDAFVTKLFDFESDIEVAQANIATMVARGGGDFPESLNEALHDTLNGLSWRRKDALRLCFILADAPPHYYPQERYTYRSALKQSRRMGVKLFPVAGSGINKRTEFLFRHMAVGTQGKYLFITDDSGIGGSHIDPDIGEFEVETLNGIMVRTILEEYRRNLNE